MRPWRQPIDLGSHGERIAARTLRRAGYRILARNARIGPFEIDIIAEDGDTTAFVEVKTRRSASFAEPEANVTRDKQRRICSAARRYIAARNDPARYYRFDVVAVVLPERGRPEVTIFRDAFQDEWGR